MQNGYNTKAMELEKFLDWFNEIFLEWRGDSRMGVSEFARYLDLRQQTVSIWLNRNIKTLPTAEHIAHLARFYPEVYEVIGLHSLDYLPGSIRDSWSEAVAEIRNTFREKGIVDGSPEADKIALEIFFKHGFNLTSIK